MSGPPDPSVGNQQEERIRNIVMGVLADPLQFPDPFTSWLQEYITMNAIPETTSTTTDTPPV